MAQTEIKVTKGAGKLQHIVTAGPHSLIADAPSAFGGDDAGFVPHDLLAAALGACTAVTLNMYAGRKELPLGSRPTAIAMVARTRTSGDTPSRRKRECPYRVRSCCPEGAARAVRASNGGPEVRWLVAC